jgi:hypothetical protein
MWMPESHARQGFADLPGMARDVAQRSACPVMKPCGFTCMDIFYTADTSEKNIAMEAI